jgi:hypothetical protein
MELAAQRRGGWLKEYVNKLITLVQKPGNESGNGTSARLLLTCFSAPNMPFQLRGIDGLSIRETAQILGLPHGSVKAQFARAVKKLKETIGGAIVESTVLKVLAENPDILYVSAAKEICTAMMVTALWGVFVGLVVLLQHDAPLG